MTRKEAFEKIKKLLKMEDDTAFANAKTADGKILQWEGDLKEGVGVMLVGEDGNMTPAEDLTYLMEDGTKITCVGGLVTAIEKKAAEEDASEMEAAFAQHLESFNTLVERLTAIETKLAEYDGKFTEITKTVTDNTTSNEEKFSKVLEIAERIAEEPAGDPDPVKNNLFKKNEQAGKGYEKVLEYLKSKKK